LMMSSIGLVRFLICVAPELQFWPSEVNKNQNFFCFFRVFFGGKWVRLKPWDQLERSAGFDNETSIFVIWNIALSLTFHDDFGEM
jgi:hypothetical protein